MNAAALTMYWVVFALSWLTISWITCRIARRTWSRSDTYATLWVLGVALIARILVVVFTQPALSDDVWRYIHDGATLGQGVNPYLHAPADLLHTGQPVPQIVERLNNPKLVTIYQPTSQFVFAGLDRFWQACPGIIQQWDPSHDKVFRFGFVLFDMLLIAMILAWLRDAGRSAWWAAAYAWHPLAISEVAASGHQDVIGIFFLVAVLWMTARLSDDRRQGPLSRKRLVAMTAGVMFALAVAVKPLVLPVALPLAWLLRKRMSLVLCAAAASLLGLAALYGPFLLMDGGLTGMFDTGRTFVDKWAFNGSLHPMFTALFGGKPWADYTALALLLAVLVAVTLREKANPARPAGVYLFASLLVSSTVHPWYLLWALALTPMWFNPAFWVFSLTVAASYAAHLYEGYRVPQWVVVGEYLPVYAILFWQLTQWLGINPRLRGRACAPVG